MRRERIPHLGGARAVVLHKPHPSLAALTRQLAAIGLQVTECWPEPNADVLGADFLFFDVDLGFDAQFPWQAGEAPMPTIALIGSEAPGRIEWALSHRADAHLAKPLGQSGVYAALLIARQGFEARRRLARELEDLRAQVAERRVVVAAALILAGAGASESEAFGRLRALAMSWRVGVEEAARRVCAARSAEVKEGGADGAARR
jgi:two-component system, response regulator / RNA-binding antiterminator